MWSAVDTVIAAFSIVSVPLHILLIMALDRSKNVFSPGFYYCIMHMSVCHILASTIKVLVDTPSNLHGVRVFIREGNHTTTDWIIGLFATARTSWLKWIMQALIALIALNRLGAVMFPMLFAKKNAHYVSRICFSIWVFYVGVRLPIIWPLHLLPYYPTDDPDRTVYRTIEQWASITYIWIGILTGVGSLAITYGAYCLIAMKLLMSNLIGGATMNIGVKRSIICAIVSSFGLLIMNFIEAGEEVMWRLYQKDIVPTDIYYLIVNVGYEYSILSLPISIFLYFPEIRLRMMMICKLSTGATLFTIGKSRRVVLRQGGGDAGSHRNTVDVQVLRDGDGSRRNTIDLQFKEGRSRKNTLELKVNGEVVPNPTEPSNFLSHTCALHHSSSAMRHRFDSDSESEDEIIFLNQLLWLEADHEMPSDPSMNSPRTLSIVRSSNNSRPATPTIENQRNNQVDNSARWTRFNPPRQFYLLKGLFFTMCLVDIMHWAYLLRDDSPENPNSWRFYKRFESFDLYYLVARMFADIFTCVLGLGAAMWTRKPLLTLPCTTTQLLFLVIRAIVWAARSFNRGLEKFQATSEDKVFVVCEFAIPLVWVLLSILIVRTTKSLRSYEQLHGYAHPPIIVLTVKNDENDESVQIEIA